MKGMLCLQSLGISCNSFLKPLLLFPLEQGKKKKKSTKEVFFVVSKSFQLTYIFKRKNPMRPMALKVESLTTSPESVLEMWIWGPYPDLWIRNYCKLSAGQLHGIVSPLGGTCVPYIDFKPAIYFIFFVSLNEFWQNNLKTNLFKSNCPFKKNQLSQI